MSMYDTDTLMLHWISFSSRFILYIVKTKFTLNIYYKLTYYEYTYMCNRW